MKQALAFVTVGLKTIRTPWQLCVLVVITSAAVCALSAMLFTGSRPLSNAEAASAITALSSDLKFSLPGLMLGILGMLTSTQEYRFGLIYGSLVAVPRRGRLIAAKTIVMGCLAAAVAVCTIVVNSIIVLAFPDLKTGELEWIGPLGRILLGYIALNVFYMLFGLAIGGLVRSVPAATLAVVLWPLMAEPFFDMAVKQLPVPEIVTHLGEILPFTAASAMAAGQDTAAIIQLPLSSLGGAIVAGCWLTLLYLIWFRSFSRRDA